MEPVNAPLIALLARLSGGGRLLVNGKRKKLRSLSWPSIVWLHTCGVIGRLKQARVQGKAAQNMLMVVLGYTPATVQSMYSIDAAQKLPTTRSRAQENGAGVGGGMGGVGARC